MNIVDLLDTIMDGSDIRRDNLIVNLLLHKYGREIYYGLTGNPEELRARIKYIQSGEAIPAEWPLEEWT